MNYGIVMPQEDIHIRNDFESYSYSIKDKGLANKAMPINKDSEDFEALLSFADKALNDSRPIDGEIQKVINDHFWDML